CVNPFQREGFAESGLSRFMSEPIAVEPRTRWPIFSGPTIFLCSTWCNPLETTQPHWLQSGVPPKIQGSTRVVRSAEKLVDIFEKTHSCGFFGGSSSACPIPGFISNLG